MLDFWSPKMVPNRHPNHAKITPGRLWGPSGAQVASKTSRRPPRDRFWDHFGIILEPFGEDFDPRESIWASQVSSHLVSRFGFNAPLIWVFCPMVLVLGEHRLGTVAGLRAAPLDIYTHIYILFWTSCCGGARSCYNDTH